MFKLVLIGLSFLLFVATSYSAPKPAAKAVAAKSKVSDIQKIKGPEELDKVLQSELNASELKVLKEKVIHFSNKSVPTLIKAMKSDAYPEKNRWMATFLLGRIMGDKSSAFIARFAEHPNWVMRLASLKTLLALKQDKYKSIYVKSLSDKSLIVRVQALDNINHLKIKDASSHVWAMLYDKSNYSGQGKQLKRTNIIKEVIKTIGDLEFKKAEAPLLSMIQNKKYQDIHNEIDYSLSKIHGKKSPVGNLSKKQHFWSRIALNNKTI
ncbi:MAG: HEAT repeat domain-containing protein [Bacteriovoracaceae bacterium]|nr:HEAT repeat domain-containing protein [Bacteriovoracaceae bacterium]